MCYQGSAIGEHGSHCQAQKEIFIVNKKLENVRSGEVLAQIDEKSRHHLNFAQTIPANVNRILFMLCCQNGSGMTCDVKHTVSNLSLNLVFLYILRQRQSLLIIAV